MRTAGSGSRVVFDADEIVATAPEEEEASRNFLRISRPLRRFSNSPAIKRTPVACRRSNVDPRLYLCFQTSGRSSCRSITALCGIPVTRSDSKPPWTGVASPVPGVPVSSVLPAAWAGTIGWSASTCHASSVRTAKCVASTHKLCTGTFGRSTATWSCDSSNCTKRDFETDVA